MPPAGGHVSSATMEIQGAVGLVTGAGRRLGRAFALAFAKAGGDVVVHCGRSTAEAEETAKTVRDLGRRAAVVQADLADGGQAASVLPRAAEALGPVTVLVNSAAIFEPGMLLDTDLSNWDRHLAINLRAPFQLMRGFAEGLGDRAGKIVNVADWRAASPGPTHLAYTVSKSGLLTLTRMAARELAPRVQVNGLALGAVLPPAGGDPADLERTVASVPAGRPATEAEVTDALLFLLRNDYVTGETLFVDGGAHLR